MTQHGSIHSMISFRLCMSPSKSREMLLIYAQNFTWNYKIRQARSTRKHFVISHWESDQNRTTVLGVDRIRQFSTVLSSWI